MDIADIFSSLTINPERYYKCSLCGKQDEITKLIWVTLNDRDLYSDEKIREQNIFPLALEECYKARMGYSMYGDRIWTIICSPRCLDRYISIDQLWEEYDYPSFLF
jgi:hypothetical protein